MSSCENWLIEGLSIVFMSASAPGRPRSHDLGRVLVELLFVYPRHLGLEDPHVWLSRHVERHEYNYWPGVA